MTFVITKTITGWWHVSTTGQIYPTRKIALWYAIKGVGANYMGLREY